MLSRCATASGRRYAGSLLVAISRHTSRPALKRCSVMTAVAPVSTVRAMAERADQQQADEEGGEQRRGADRDGDAWTDEGVVLHRDGERRTPDGRPRRQVGVGHGASAYPRAR